MTFGRAKRLDLELLLMPSTNEKPAALVRDGHLTPPKLTAKWLGDFNYFCTFYQFCCKHAGLVWLERQGADHRRSNTGRYRLANCRCPGFRNSE